jgi:hypothetical protein
MPGDSRWDGSRHVRGLFALLACAPVVTMVVEAAFGELIVLGSRRSRSPRRAAGLLAIYPALSVIVATVTWGHRTLLKIRITSCEYCSCR